MGATYLGLSVVGLCQFGGSLGDGGCFSSLLDGPQNLLGHQMDGPNEACSKHCQFVWGQPFSIGSLVGVVEEACKGRDEGA